MNTKFKAPCWVKLKSTGQVLRCRSISRANNRMRHDGWKGLVCHVQNEKGTGIVSYHDVCAPTESDLAAFNTAVRKRFGV